jgi:hypothetical protein
MTEQHRHHLDDDPFKAFENGDEFPLVFDGEMSFFQYQGRGWMPSHNGGESVGVLRSSRGGFLVATNHDAALMLDAFDDDDE